MSYLKFEKVKTKLYHSYKQLIYNRKTRLYCVGAAKTGTHSIESMFNNMIRSGHEPDDQEVIDKIIKLSMGQISEKSMISYIRKRDNKLCLDVDSSQLNFYFISYIIKEFTDALFLLTIRDCYSWLDSFINHSLSRSTSKNWIKFRDFRFQADLFSHPPEEQVLKLKGLYTLDGYLSYWAYHNNKVLDSILSDRLMVVRTNEITSKALNIANFAGLPKESVQTQKTHSYKNPQKYNILQEVPEDYLEAKVSKHCEPLMAKYFPEIKSIKDARI